MKNGEVIVLVGSGAIGVAIARRVSIGKILILADIDLENADRQAQILREAGYQVHTVACNVADRNDIRQVIAMAQSLGEIKGLIHTAGVSPSQASVEMIFRVDLLGTAILFEEFGKVIAKGGSAVVIGSQSSHRLEPLTAEQNRQLATFPTEKLLEISLVKETTDTLKAYQIAKRGNALRVQYEAVQWGKREARINCISAGIIHTPLANDELNGERKEFYRKMLAGQPAGRGGTPDEIATLAELTAKLNAVEIVGARYVGQLAQQANTGN